MPIRGLFGVFLLWGILVFDSAFGLQESVAEGPQPISIDRNTHPPHIPVVARDRVIGFALYTVHDDVLKLSAQLYPLLDDEERWVRLETRQSERWVPLARANVEEQGWLARFRVENWDDSKDHLYRLTHPGGATYEGVIRKDPINKDEIVVAAFTGNSNSDRGMRPDIIRNIKTLNPDLLFFSGDQSYDHDYHTAAWLSFGRQFGEIIKDRPTVTIPDDHDVGQANLWGEGGKVSRLNGGADGGYVKSANYVNMVQRAQTSHLPDPYDPTPVRQGISVYFTSLTLGGVGFAILEDRKWKTGPAGFVPRQGNRPDHIGDTEFDRSSVDLPEARLLGERQLEFLHEWGQSWTGMEMKAVLSQTIFGAGAHIHGAHDARLVADLDSNGWPQSGRARALREIRRFFGFHIGGDQHLATVIHHGVNGWEDSIYSFGVPSIVNFYGRWWWPLELPMNHDPNSSLPFTGRFYDGFGNKLTMHAYANPTKENYNGAGFGLVRFKKSTREIVMECWPRHVDTRQPDARQYPGWPVTIQQEDNYGREAQTYLPVLRITGQADAVVQVVDEDLDEIVYTIRINGSTWHPKVFRDGTYTIRVGEGAKRKSIRNVESVGPEEVKTLEVAF